MKAPKTNERKMKDVRNTRRSRLQNLFKNCQITPGFTNASRRSTMCQKGRAAIQALAAELAMEDKSPHPVTGVLEKLLTVNHVRRPTVESSTIGQRTWLRSRFPIRATATSACPIAAAPIGVAAAGVVVAIVVVEVRRGDARVHMILRVLGLLN